MIVHEVMNRVMELNTIDACELYITIFSRLEKLQSYPGLSKEHLANSRKDFLEIAAASITMIMLFDLVKETTYEEESGHQKE
jgi:hypothetical protein